MTEGRWSDILKGPRWAGGKDFLFKLAAQTDLDLKMDSEKGWFTESIRFTVTGDPEKIKTFRRKLVAAVQAYNK